MGDQFDMSGDFRHSQIYIKSVIEGDGVAPVSLHQLPPPPADFTGREEELTELAQAITQGGVTISGLRGMGGVGKTALALKLAEQLVPQYPDAQFYLDLWGTSDHPLTPAHAMAHVIRAYHPTIRLPESEAELAGLYRSVLHKQRALLLMDNARDRGQMEPLIPPVGNLLLVTSRWHFRLPGLKALDLDTLPSDDARDMLLKIAPRVGVCVDELVRVCGHLPLALRIAGSALAERIDLAPEAYLARLAEGREHLDEVNVSLSLSYELLSKELRRLWCILSVFPGTFDRAAATATWQMQEDQTQDALGELVRYSLVEWHPDARRYRLHDLTRLFADSRLEEGDRTAGQWRYAVYYKGILRIAESLYLQGYQAVSYGLALFDLEWENIQAGQRWAATHAGVGPAESRLCTAYPDAGVYCLELRLHPQEYIRWLEPALAAAKRLQDRDSEGTYLGNLGVAYHTLGEVERAKECYEQALFIARQICDRKGEGKWLCNLGAACRDLGQVRQAITCLDEALFIARETGDRGDESEALGNMGVAYSFLGETERATEYLEQALVIDREIGNRKGQLSRLNALGLSYYEQEQTEQAMECFEQALPIAHDLGDRKEESGVVGNLGLVYRRLGRTKQAMGCFEQALLMTREFGDRRGEGIWLGNLGDVYSDMGQAKQAFAFYEHALSIARESSDRRNEGVWVGALGLAYCDMGKVEQGMQCLEQASLIAKEIRDRNTQAYYLFRTGPILYELGEQSRAIEHVEAALEIFEEIRSPHVARARALLTRWREQKQWDVYCKSD